MCFDKGGQTFNPIPIIAIQQAINFSDFGIMNMTANHAVTIAHPRFASHDVLKISNKTDCVFYLMLEILRKRPVLKTHPDSNAVEISIKEQDKRIETVANIREPLGVLHDAVKQITVSHPEFSAIYGRVYPLFDHLNFAERHAEELTKALVMIARDIDDLCAFARLTQKLLDNIVMSLRLVEVFLQPPSIYDVTHQIKRICLVMLQEIEEVVGLTTWGAQVYV